MKKIAFLLLSILSSATMAGTYNSADGNKDAAPENNKASNKHFYVDVGVNSYYFDGPGTYVPASTGESDPQSDSGSTPFNSYDPSKWQVMPTLTLGYELLSLDKNLQKIFGEQNAVEIKASYFHNSSSEVQNYPNGTPVNPWIITGDGPFDTGSSYHIDSNDWDYDNTYVNFGVYYTGKKVIQSNLINSPYVGVSLSYLKQDSSYTSYMTSSDDSTPIDSTGSDDIDSYYTGLEFGDKLTLPFKRQFSVYGKAGLGLYLLHTSLDATQLPRVQYSPFVYLNTTYNVSDEDNKFAYKALLESGVSYYFGKNNQNPLSPSLTLLAGVEYWSDVAYADNPTQANEQVSIAYDDSINPYAGLQLHYPIA